MTTRVAIYAGILAGLAILQTNVLGAIEIAGVRPDLALIVIAYFSVTNGSFEGQIGAFAGGLVEDLLSLAPPGFHALLRTLMGFLYGLIHNRMLIDAVLVPFLLLAVIFYGLIPRVLILIVTVIRQNRAIRRLSFKQAACDQLLSAMKTPRVQTRSRAYKKQDERSSGAESTKASAGPASSEASVENLDPAVVMIPEDLAGQYQADELRERIQIRLGLDLKTAISCGFDPDADARAVKDNLPGDMNLSDIRVVIIQEAWQPPIQETLSWIGAIRRRADIPNSLIIGLIGRPAAHSIFTPPADTERIIWEHAVAKLGDPYVRVEVLGE